MKNTLCLCDLLLAGLETEKFDKAMKYLEEFLVTSNPYKYTLNINSTFFRNVRDTVDISDDWLIEKGFLPKPETMLVPGDILYDLETKNELVILPSMKLYVPGCKSFKRECLLYTVSTLEALNKNLAAKYILVTPK